MFAVYLDVKGIILSVSRPECSPEKAFGMVRDFFHSSQVPDIDGWNCDEFAPTQKKETHLNVGGQEFRRFGFVDVMFSLENIRDGKAEWLHLCHTGEDGGYIWK